MVTVITWNDTADYFKIRRFESQENAQLVDKLVKSNQLIRNTKFLIGIHAAILPV